MLNELRERGSLCSLLQRPALTGRKGGENTEYRQTITAFHLFCQREMVIVIHNVGIKQTNACVYKNEFNHYQHYVHKMC